MPVSADVQPAPTQPPTHTHTPFLDLEETWSGKEVRGYFWSIKSHLKVLPAAPAGQVLHNEAVFSANRWPVLIPAGAIPAAVASTFNKTERLPFHLKPERSARSLQTEPVLFLSS